MKIAKQKRWMMFAAAMFIGACATMPAPKTINQKIAYAKATGEGLNRSIAQLLTSDIITVETAIKYRDMAVKARGILATAERYAALGDSALAIKSWEEANVLLLELNGILLEQAQRGEL